MKLLYRYITLPLLTLLLLFGGQGLTICTMACLETGEVQISINSESNCCEEEEDACCNENEEDGCCNHNDNTVQLDKFIDGKQVIENEFQAIVIDISVVQIFLKNDELPSNEGHIPLHSPPLIQVDDFRTFVHSYII